MVLKYMISDDGLAKGELGHSETKVQQPKKKVVSDWRKQGIQLKERPSPKRNMKFWLFLMVIVILGPVAYYLWRADLISPALDILPTGKVVVTAIVYGEENASAIVSDKVVHEGDIIDDCKVVKIYRDKVEFEKDGKRFTKHVR
ncbi:MAG: hypothetical protein FVQ85_06640 [Planctomycetes bacterium]|nr:hypothetical protein [Planctomycetota bacterium]